MTTIQKVIKYIAIAFAMFLIVNIISAIIFGLYTLTGILGLNKKIETISNEENITTNYKDIQVKDLDIKTGYTNLTIKTGKYLKVETNNKDIMCKQDNEKLKIEEKHNDWFSKNNSEELVIYIPENFIFQEVRINNGAGNINIEILNAKTMLFELGAGKVEINNINIFEKAKIEGGAGKFSILSGKINDLDLDMGVGKTDISSLLTGKTQVNAGIGKLDININGQKEDYEIKIDKGIGSIKVDNKEMEDNKTYGNGSNYIKVDGGIGSIDVNFKEN